MPLEPKIPKPAFQTKKCTHCNSILSTESFARSHSIFYPDGFLPICNSCIDQYLNERDYSWEAIDKLCQWSDIPFIVKEWTRIADLNSSPSEVWPVYARVFADDCYANLGWADYNQQYLKLREVGQIEDEIPLVRDKRMQELRDKWGANYDDQDLFYLEDLYKGLLQTQNVNGALQFDQAKKACKLSLEIDSKIRAGDKDVDKFLSSYDKLIKMADFTPKNTKNAVDFDSFAEVGHWLEKRGRQNKFYDNVTRDVIDETLKNVESYNQRLYINEGGIGDEITQRLQALNHAQEENQLYDIQPTFDADKYDDEGYTTDALDEEEEFIPMEEDMEIEGLTKA